MATEKSGAVPQIVIPARLPWLVGAAAFPLYLLTLNYWVSLAGLGLFARVSGWAWRPEFDQPLTLLVSYPFRALPHSWLASALNAFTAALAASVLVLLARSVMLLPHDVAPAKPVRGIHPRPVLSIPSAWLPPVIAALACGLELNFWEHATSATGEILDLLTFAFVILCLLEFRLSLNETWLNRAAFVYAAGASNHWLLLAWFPVFIFAILRSKGLDHFLKLRFLGRMTLFGLAGSSLYLLLPLVHGLSGPGEPGFWLSLKVHLRSQLNALQTLRTPALRVLLVTSLLPFVLISIRWKSHTVTYGDDNKLGIRLTKVTGHFVHSLALLASLWVLLDPALSPRHLGLDLPMLSFYYVSALTLGYCVGYFLLLGSAKPRSSLPKIAGAAARLLVCVLSVALLWKNLPELRFANGPTLRNFARQLESDLPPGKSVVLGDDLLQLLLLRAQLASHASTNDPLLVDVPALASARYQTFMAKRFKSRWPLPAPAFDAQSSQAAPQLALVSNLVAREPAVYLLPRPGLILEHFNALPRGTTCLLQPLTPNSSPRRETPPQSADSANLVLANEQLWQRRWADYLQPLATRLQNASNPGKPPSPLRKTLRLLPERNHTAAIVAGACSKALNVWGVESQRLGIWSNAAVWFERALALNPANLAAQINLEFNQRWQRGEKSRLTLPWLQSSSPDALAKYNNWTEVLEANGPVDEPTFLFRTGRVLQTGNCPRQARDAFTRSAVLAPDWPPPLLWQARTSLDLRDFVTAAALTESVQALSRALDSKALPDLLSCRTSALRGLGRSNEAAAFLQDFLQQHPDNPDVISAAADCYARSLQFESEIALLDELLKRAPNRPDLLARKGLAELRLSRYDPAIATLTSALSSAPGNHEARLQRAIASLGAGQLDDAQRDYTALLKVTNAWPNAVFGLATVAWRRHETNSAIRYYQQYLSKAVLDSPQYSIATQRLAELKSPR